jgi:hypothetical protein
MDKREFRRRLERAAERARQFAERFVVQALPPSILYTISAHDDPEGRRGPPGTIKFFGGRFLNPRDLALVSSARTADLFWVDGCVPSWINLNVESADATATHVRTIASGLLVKADEPTLQRDLPAAVDKNDPVEPFRIRGPAVPHDWRSVERDGRISLPSSPRDPWAAG